MLLSPLLQSLSSLVVQSLTVFTHQISSLHLEICKYGFFKVLFGCFRKNSFIFLKQTFHITHFVPSFLSYFSNSYFISNFPDSWEFVEILKELSLDHKLWFSKPYIFTTQYCGYLIFLTLNYVRWNNLSLKYQRF